MKKISILFSVLFLAFLVGCEEEPFIYDVDGGKTALSFASTSFNISVPEEDLAFEVPVNVTTVSNQDRTFTATVDSATNPNEFTLGDVVIPAGEYNGSLTVNFDFSEIGGADGDVKTVVVSLLSPADGNVYSETATIDYFREIVCNDPVLTVMTDAYADETGFFIENSAGNRVFEIPAGTFPGGANTAFRQTYVIQVPTLPDGAYEITITDVFSDGQNDGGYVGNYSLDCSIINLATGGGSFGASQTRSFEINP